MSVWFAEYVFDAERRELLRDEKPVHLTPGVRERLALLRERHDGRVQAAGGEPASVL